MKYILKIIPLIVVLVFIYSCDTDIPQKNVVKDNLKLEFNNFNEPYGLMYGFWGDQQIFIDTLKVVNGTINYPISEKCNKGVYRIIFNQFGFEFIYNYENLHFKIDALNELQPFEIISSVENKRLFAFHEQLTQVLNSNDSIAVCKRLLEIKKSLNTESTVFADQIIRLNLLDFDKCVHLNDSVLDESQSQLTLSEDLLATPYFISTLMKDMSSVDPNNTMEIQNSFNKWMKASDGSQIVQHFITVVFHELAFTKSNQNFLIPITSDSECIFWDTVNYPEFAIGSKVEDDLIKNTAEFNKNQKHILVFNSNNCEIPHDVLRTYEKEFSDNKSMKMYLFNLSEVPEHVRYKYNLAVTPTVLALDGGYNLISRWTGLDDCQRITK